MYYTWFSIWGLQQHMDRAPMNFMKRKAIVGIFIFQKSWTSITRKSRNSLFMQCTRISSKNQAHAPSQSQQNTRPVSEKHATQLHATVPSHFYAQQRHFQTSPYSMLCSPTCSVQTDII